MRRIEYEYEVEVQDGGDDNEESSSDDESFIKFICPFFTIHDKKFNHSFKTFKK